MKKKLLNIKNKLVALWWFLTRKDYYLLSYNGRKSEFLESGNVVIPEFIEWVRKKHGVPTNHEIIMELKNIGVQVKPYNVQDGFMDMFVNGEVYDMFVKFVKENNLEVIYDNIHHWDIFTWCDATIWF